MDSHGRDTCLTSDAIGFNGFRVLIRELPKEHQTKIRPNGSRCFTFQHRPFREKDFTLVSFQDDSDHHQHTLNRIVFIMPPGEPFVWSWQQATGRIVSFEVDPRFVEKIHRLAGMSSQSIRRVLPMRFAVSRQVDELCQLLVRETENGGRTGRLYFKSLATAMLVAIFSQAYSHIPETGTGEPRQRRIQQAIALMEAKFASKLTRDDVARAANLSPFHFSRLFRRVMGLSPHEYLLQRRLCYARHLLTATRGDRSIAHVAAEAGFADQAHLTRQFRRVYGVTPGAFRRAHE